VVAPGEEPFTTEDTEGAEVGRASIGVARSSSESCDFLIRASAELLAFFVEL